jgi:hypothetical protein
MQLTSEQLQAAERGEAVRIETGGKILTLLSRRFYGDTIDDSPWASEEIGLPADLALDLDSGDGLD